MVSGWDKSPSPQNDYTPKPMTRTECVKFTLFALAVLVFIVLM